MADGLKRTRSTTICTVVRNGVMAMAADQQVTWGSTPLVDVRFRKTMTLSGKLCGFSGTVGGSLVLRRLIEKYAPDWNRVAYEAHADKLANDPDRSVVALIGPVGGQVLCLSAQDGSVMMPDTSVMAIGSGCDYALGAGKALLESTDWSAAGIAAKAIEIAASLCIYTSRMVDVRVAECAEGS